MTDKSFTTLYKQGSKGEIRQWDIRVYCDVIDDVEVAVIESRHGQMGGQIQISTEHVRQGKNIGRANETTMLEQAQAQAESKWTKQLDKYYAKTIEEAKKKKNTCTRPMLAHPYADKAHKLPEGTPVIYQPKLDGMRCIAQMVNGEVALISRGQKPIVAVPRIAKALKGIMQEGEVWDGELYHDDIDFNDLMSMCRKKKPTPEDLERSSRVQYHIFDAIAPGSYSERFYTTVRERLVQYDSNSSPDRLSLLVKFGFTGLLVPVVSVFENFEIEILDRYLELWEGQGYEGAMIRIASAEYQHKKTVDLLKYKTFQDAEYVVVGCKTGTAGTKKDGLLQTFVLEATNNKGATETFKASLLGSEEELREKWTRRDEFIGQLATVKFQECSKYGIPRFPKVKGIRWEGDLTND